MSSVTSAPSIWAPLGSSTLPLTLPAGFWPVVVVLAVCWFVTGSPGAFGSSSLGSFMVAICCIAFPVVIKLVVLPDVGEVVSD